MKKIIISFIVITFSLVLITEAKTVSTTVKVYKPKCEPYARQILKLAMHSTSVGPVELIESKPTQYFHVPADSNIEAEELVFLSEGLTATFTILVGMHEDGSCDLHGLAIGRD